MLPRRAVSPQMQVTDRFFRSILCTSCILATLKYSGERENKTFPDLHILCIENRFKTLSCELFKFKKYKMQTEILRNTNITLYQNIRHISIINLELSWNNVIIINIQDVPITRNLIISRNLLQIIKNTKMVLKLPVVYQIGAGRKESSH